MTEVLRRVSLRSSEDWDARCTIFKGRVVWHV